MKRHPSKNEITETKQWSIFLILVLRFNVPRAKQSVKLTILQITKKRSLRVIQLALSVTLVIAKCIHVLRRMQETLQRRALDDGVVGAQ